jgi:hypothetical protein
MKEQYKYNDSNTTISKWVYLFFALFYIIFSLLIFAFIYSHQISGDQIFHTFMVIIAIFIAFQIVVHIETPDFNNEEQKRFLYLYFIFSELYAIIFEAILLIIINNYYLFQIIDYYMNMYAKSIYFALLILTIFPISIPIFLLSRHAKKKMEMILNE